jgi:glutathione synthase
MKHNQNRKRHLKIGFLMDPMEKILLDVDTSISIMMEAQKRGHQIFYMEPDDLVCENGTMFAEVCEVSTSRTSGFRIISQRRLDLKTMDVIFNRKEPPFDISYLYLTQLLELIERDVFIINSPRGLRKANEKLYILEFPKWIPPTFASNEPKEIDTFFKKQKSDVIIKPLDERGGRGIRLIRRGAKNALEILNETTQCGAKWIMAQKFLKAGLTQGDKRILLLNGEVIGQFGKIPKAGEFRANLSLGARYVRTSLTGKERRLIQAIKPQLLKDGLYFVGMDVIDGKLLEINVTSPAGLPEISELEGTRPEVRVVDFLEKQASKHQR